MTTTPKILFIRPRYGSALTRLTHMNTEPLDLEYLSAVANQHHCEWKIHDPAVDGESFHKVFKLFQPDILAITGYYPAKDRMLEHARFAKSKRPDIITIIGGVHAELNATDFYDNTIDLIVHSGGALTFSAILQAILNNQSINETNGTCVRQPNSQWLNMPVVPLDPNQLPRPDRSHFYRYRRKFTWLYHGPVALVKTAYGCPFQCSFCYCRLLNNGLYTTRNVDDVVDEIASIDNPLIWITDDSFLLDMARIRTFATALQARKLTRQFIIYSRAGFIAQHPEVVPLLKQMGVINVIIGLESTDERTLTAFNKSTSMDENEACVRLLYEHTIECTGLFIMPVDATHAGFRHLQRWITHVGLRLYTVSIFTPFPGTTEFADYQDKLTTHDCRKWDLLHLVLTPSHMSRAMFYLRMGWVHGRMVVGNVKLKRYYFH
ncbi:cobalamin-dependent protein [candidate division KSB1 bacterium]|nr:cobalamin-dependent protein [candidate division KSB1 bacterium]